MLTKNEYHLRIKGMEDGIYHFEWVLDHRFHQLLKHPAFTTGTVLCSIDLEKKGDLFIFDFTFKGKVDVACDRCTADIQLPIYQRFRLWGKYENEEGEMEETDDDMQEDWVPIKPQDENIDLQAFIVDYMILSIPQKLTYDCRNEMPFPCDEEVLDKIGYFEIDDQKEQSTSSVWDDLKSIQWD